ncbi:hypothetical protein [Streptomyces poonensis]|uniref:Uncharacterized protein n=1 Tax=Streptomyces poonensis TaxID=68255 RepID=A0A918P874_9ACTN|nr:hypothetical protein [Streptomyces poonensis]GGY86425.1 hypothetical protein GCM10010365_00380 [Streptomyces poonensis]GLJ92242.1 hypothetical protein GCM10017589_48510 [Streptomyces poonensis]
MLALRLARGARPAVHLRRLLVTAASGGTAFLLLCVLGHAITHPETPARSVLRLAWCAGPLAATAYCAVTVARTDPATRPRPGLSAIGLGPRRLMALSAMTTALSGVIGSLFALFLFLHLRGEPERPPFTGDAARALAPGLPLPLPAALTLLSVVPAVLAVTVALALRPAGPGPWWATLAEGRGLLAPRGTGADASRQAGADGARQAGGSGTRTAEGPGGVRRTQPGRLGGRRLIRAGVRRGGNGSHALSTVLDTCEPALTATGAPAWEPDPYTCAAPQPAPGGLPWGVAVLAVGLAIEAYASSSGSAPALLLPGGFAHSSAGALAGWLLTTLGLVLAGPGLTHLCGRLLQAVRPGALRLLAGRVLQEEARRIGRPLGVLCAVACGVFTMATLYSGARHSIGPFTTLGGLVMVGCTVMTLAIVATEARDARAGTTAALVRLGAPATMLRTAALLRVGALLALFGPLTWVIAALTAAPLRP